MPSMLQARLGCLVPGFWPVDSTNWDTLINTHTTFPTTPIAVVLNISSGAGSSTVTTWSSLITRLRNAGIIVLGYVGTNFAADSTATVNARTDAWKSFYPAIDGIYFDSMSNQSTNQSYYSTVSTYAKTTKGFATTAANAKGTVPTAFIGGNTVDTIVIYDASGLDAVDSTYSQYDSLTNNTMAVMAFGIPAIDSRWVAQMGAYVGWIYTTTGSGSTPYATLPSYFNSFIQLLDDLGSGRLAGQNVDKWGINKLYHTKTGGEEYFTDQNNLTGDTARMQNFEGENFTKLSDGSWQSDGGSDNGDLRLEIWSPAYADQNQRKAACWLNCEVTVYARVTNIDSSRDPPYAFQLYCKGGHHSSTDPCQGAAYKARWWNSNGQNSIAKEVCHSAYSSNQANTTGNVTGHYGNNKWYGAKFCQYNIVENGNTYVKLEVYTDPDCSDANNNLVIRNNWKLTTSYVDRGDLFVSQSCYDSDCDGCGRARNEILNKTYAYTNSSSKNFNRNLAAYRTDGVTSRIKYFSCREIDPNKPVASVPTSEGETPGTGTVDSFGVKKIFPTITNGYEWEMDMTNPNVNTSKFNTNVSVTKNADGSWKCTSNNVQMYVYQRNGYNSTTTANAAGNHATIASRGYMQDSNDWRNVEMTGYVKLNNIPITVHDDFQWMCRGGRHLEPPPNCEGSALRGHVGDDGTTQCVKEQFHVAFVGETRKPGINQSIVGKWIGFKFIVVTKVVSGTTVTNQQIWIDPTNTNTWTKYDERTDSGGWGNQDSTCNGSNDQIISWGAPLCIFAWQSFTDVDFRWLSVREIDPNAIPIDDTNPPAPSHCSG